MYLYVFPKSYANRPIQLGVVLIFNLGLAGIIAIQVYRDILFLWYVS